MGSVRWRKVLRDFTAYPVADGGRRRVGGRRGLRGRDDRRGVRAAVHGPRGRLCKGGRRLPRSTRGRDSTRSSCRPWNGCPASPTPRPAGRSPPGWSGSGGLGGRNPGDEPGRGALEIQLIALPDFDDQRIDRVLPRSGEFPPDRGEIVFERSALRLVDVERGTTSPPDRGGRRARLRVDGLAYEPGASPAYYFGRLSAYVTLETLVDLGWPATFNELRIRNDPGDQPRGVQAIADDVRQRLSGPGPGHLRRRRRAGPSPGTGDHRGGLPYARLDRLPQPVRGRIPDHQHDQRPDDPAAAPDRDHEGPRGRFGRRSSACTSRSWPCMRWSRCVSRCRWPRWGRSRSQPRRRPPQRRPRPDDRPAGGVVALEVVAGFAVPLLASIVPIRRGVRITVHAALTDTGLDERFGRGAMDRLLARVRGMSRPLLLSRSGARSDARAGSP